MRFQPIRRAAQVIAINITIAACLLEVMLRAQQAIWPLYDLAIAPETIFTGLSNELNHVHADPDWDAAGIQKMDEPNPPDCATRVLFLGDSFMQGLARSDTIPVHVRDFFQSSLGRKVCVFNAGASSYSPSIYIVQAKQLIPLLHPDFVVVDIDETDLYDDYYRYRELTSRDAAGSISSVRLTPLFLQFHQGLIDSTNKPLYLHRLLAKLYFTKIKYPRIFAEYAGARPADIFVVSRRPLDKAKAEYGAPIAYFRQTLSDLTTTILARMSDPGRLIYIHHPHLQHLANAGGVFNDVLADSVRDVAHQYNVRFFDATDRLRSEFDGNLGRYYIRDDMHFNSRGLRAYAIAVAKYLAGPIFDSGYAD
jgi:hypothetical protein